MSRLSDLLEAPEVVMDDGRALSRKVEAHVHEALRHVFRGRMVVEARKMGIREGNLILDINIRLAKWTGSAVDEMNEAVAGEPTVVDEARIVLHELVDLVPLPLVSGPQGPGTFPPVSNDKAALLISALERARRLL